MKKINIFKFFHKLGETGEYKILKLSMINFCKKKFFFNSS